MNKVLVEFGHERHGYVLINSEVEIEFVDERDFVKKCLLEEFGSEKDCEECWKDYLEIDNMEEIVEEVIRIKRMCEEIGEGWVEFGYAFNESGFFRVKDR